MHITNTDEEYGAVARFFHWSIAVLILALLPVGLFMTGMDNSPVKFQVYALHKSFGLVVFFLGLGRIVWRLVSTPPEHLETHAKWERALAGAAHFWLYVCVIGMPLTGWLMSSALEFPVPFFGLQMPWITEKNEQLGHLFGDMHEILAYTLMFVLGLHIAGALKHHFIDKDDTLQRMAFRVEGKGKKWALGVVIFLIVDLAFGVAGFFILKDIWQKKTGTGDAVFAVTDTPPPAATQAAGPPDTSNLPKDGWAIVPQESNLLFSTTMYETPFTGTFRDFSGEIIFNPEDLANAKADIRIGLDNISTGDADRDSNIIGPDWFDVAQNPDARFETVSIEHVDANNYMAVGNLTLRGVTMPVTLPFTLDIDGDTAKMKGSARIDRLNFGMGTGEWEDPKTVGREVEVLIELTVIR